MSGQFRRKRSGARAANTGSQDQGSDLKLNPYKLRRRNPDLKPLSIDIKHLNGGPPAQYFQLNDEQLAFATVDNGLPIKAQPFLKWVGGKKQLLGQFDKFFPKQITRYIEPFVGGGAVLFHLRHRFPQMQISLHDNNAELINAYTVVRDHPFELMRRLDRHLSDFVKDRKGYYEFIRGQHDLPTVQVVERAARMIFLNKTCFNGLWRVNSEGKFNVPFGKHKNPALYYEDKIEAACRALGGVHLKAQNFSDSLRETRRGDFVYIDPPYAPVSATANFTSYTKDPFGAEQQRILAALFTDAAIRGVRLMLSNSDTPFIRDLYRDFEIHTVSARRAVNSNGSKRGAVNEVVVLAGT